MPDAVRHEADSSATKSRAEEASRTALVRAAAELRRGLRAIARAAEGAAGDFEFSRMEREWEQLQKWAARSGLILPPGFPAPEKTESREHDVTYRSAERRWWKYTKPHGAGLAVTSEGKDRPFSHNATPLEYFDRLRAANVLLADDIRLEDCGGIHQAPGGLLPASRMCQEPMPPVRE